MNFTDYDWLRKRGPQMISILDDCIEAERCARLRPAQTRIVSRRALENIITERCRKYRIRFTTLFETIPLVVAQLALPSEMEKMFFDYAECIRDTGNGTVHVKRGGTDKVHAATASRIQDAISILEKLYWILSKIYGEPRNKHFDPVRVPFDEYEINRKVIDPTNNTMTRYFVRGANGRSYLLQSLSNKEMAEFEKRRQAANKLVYENRRRHGDRLLLPTNIPLPYESDCKLLLYDAYPESTLLCELKKPMRLKDSLKVGLDLIEALEKLQQLGMNHRGIYPGCIMVEAGEKGGCESYLMDLHTSKINNSNVTVNAKLASAYDSSQYVPDCLRGKSLAEVDWEKVDVYAVCRVVLFCLDSRLVHCSSTGMFRDHAELRRAYGMWDIYDRIFSTDSKLRSVPTLANLKELFQNEYRNCN